MNHTGKASYPHHDIWTPLGPRRLVRWWPGRAFMNKFHFRVYHILCANGRYNKFIYISFPFPLTTVVVVVVVGE